MSYKLNYMKMCKFVPAFLVGFLFVLSLQANNVKIIGDVKVDPKNLKGNIATFEFQVEWENSWRDEFNYDAVYVFLKYKLDDTDQMWNHIYLLNDATVGEDGSTPFDFKMINSGTDNRNEGIMIWRRDAGAGKATAKLRLQWDITSGEKVLTTTNFTDGKVFMSAMAIEMVYVPQGAFRAGDSQRGKHFHHKYLPIPEKWDIVSDQYTIITKDNVKTPGYLPEFAANHLNDQDRTTLPPTNAWVGDGSSDQFWCIDFGEKNGKLTNEKKTVSYIAIESAPGYVPQEWELIGTNVFGDANPKVLLRSSEVTNGGWVTDAHQVYPANYAMKIPEDRRAAYRYYQLKIKNLGSAKGPAIKTIAMCEGNLESLYDNSVLITKNTTTLTDKWGLDADYLYTEEDGMNTGVTTEAYPNGYPAFFTMKYEISQEQYIAFLNKLTLSQQNTRTVGEKLVSMPIGQYVFGDNATTAPYRNGIVLASRSGLTDPVVFANDLNKIDEFAQDGDGQTLACNFLTPADMLAYADWTGLRPMSELEYEKMSRQPYPAVPQRGEYAWNTTTFNLPVSLDSPGKRSETVSGGNANGGNVAAIGGPVRCGAFAKGAANQEASGTSFWGVMDLSGNLAEIYYNLNVEGRKFSGIPRNSHGNGKILSKTGDSDMAAGLWPVNGDAFALRGGSFQSTATELQTSDRTNNIGVFTTGAINVRKPNVTFRLGCSVPETTVKTVLTMQNGLNTTTGTVGDTICSGEDYLLRGDIPESIKGAYTIAWFYSGDKGVTWNIMEGENGKNLRLKNLRNVNVGKGVLKEYRYMRRIYSSAADAVSDQAIVRVINHEVSVSPKDMSVTVANASATITIESKLPMTLQWGFKDNPKKDPRNTVEAGIKYTHAPVYEDFNYRGVVNTGEQPLVFYHSFYDKFCASTDTVKVTVVPAPGTTELPENVVCGSAFKDTRDGQGVIYNTVAIGTQCWMAENLNYNLSDSKCYDDDINNCLKYGRLYNWSQATGIAVTNNSKPADVIKGICPDGWHLPSDEEWKAMSSAAGGGDHIKSPYWGGKDNRSGFSALPGGGFFYEYKTGNVDGHWKTTAGIDTRNGYWDAEIESSTGTRRAWWWTSTSASARRTFSPDYYSWNWDYNADTYLPYYVRLDDSGNMVHFGESTVNSNTRIYFTNSIFCTEATANGNNGSYQFLWDIVQNGNTNTVARQRMRQQFYFSVRCVRDKPVQDYEKN